MSDTLCLQRNLNNAFAYDLVPSPSVIIAALKAARRVNDFPTAVRVFEGTLRESTSCTYMPQPLLQVHSVKADLGLTTVITGIKAKVENKGQYDEYINELESIRQELGIELKESLYPEASS